MQDFARTMALPGRHKPLRYPSFPALERTATMSFNVPKQLDCPAGDTRVMVCRQAAYPAWASTTFPIDKQYMAGSIWKCQDRGATSAAIGTAFHEPVGSSISHYVSTAGTTSPSSTKPGLVGTNLDPFPGGNPILGIDEATGPVEWLYVPSGAYIVVCANFSANWTGEYRIQLEDWDAPGQTSSWAEYGGSVSASNSVGHAGLVFASGGGGRWVRIVGVWLSSNATVVRQVYMSLGIVMNASSAVITPQTGANWPTITAVAASEVKPFFFPAAFPVEFANSKLPWYSARCTAAAALFTNTTKVLNKEGTVLWGRVAPQAINIWHSVDKTYITTLHPAEKAFLPLESGTYTYVPPSTDLTRFLDYSSNSTGEFGAYVASSVPLVRLDNDSLVNIGFINDIDGGTSLAMNVDWHLEFRTSSTLFDIGLSNSPIEALHGAQLILLKHGFFFDNFDHVAMINRLIQFAGSMYPFMRLAAPVAKGFYRATSTASTKLLAPPRATSAARSGIVGSRRSNPSSQSVASRVTIRPSDSISQVSTRSRSSRSSRRRARAARRRSSRPRR